MVVKLAIGDTARINNVPVICEEGASSMRCTECAFHDDEHAEVCVRMSCVPFERIDGKLVFFKEMKA